MKVNKPFAKKLLIYFLMLAVPLCGFVCYYYRHTLRLYKEQELENYKHMVHQLKLRTEENVNQFNGFMLQISYEANMLKKSGNSIDGKEITSRLLNYKLMNPLVHEIILYYHNEEILYTSQYATQVSNFTPHFYPYKNWNKDDFYNEINGINEQGIKKKKRIDGEGYDEFITFIYPLEDREAKIFGTLLILVEEPKLYDMVRSGIDSGSNLFIVDKDSQLVSTLNNVSYLSDYNYLNILNYLSENNGQEIIIDKQKNFIMDIKSEELDWHFVMTGSIDGLTARVKSPVLHTIKVLGLTCVVVFIAFSISVFYDQRYLNMLYENITKYSKFSNRTNKETVLAALNNLLILKENDIIDKILFEDLEEQQVIDMFKLIGIELEGSQFGASVIITDSKLNEEVIRTYMNDSKWDCRYLVMKRLLPNYYMLIYETNLDIDVMKKALEELSANCQRITYISMGRHMKKISRIRKSYEEALECLAWNGYDLQKIKYKHDLFYRFHEFFPDTIIKGVKEAIEHGDVNRVKKEMEELSQHVSICGTPYFVVKSMFFLLINQLASHNENIRQALLSGKMHKYLEGAFHDNDRLLMTFSSFLEYCSKINHKKKTSEDFIEEMKLYIKSNVDNPNFSLSMMASYFAVSLSYASRFFKKSMGMTAQEYLQQCRMEIAQELLLTTDLNLKDVAEQIGYYNVSSFIRIFKKYYHQTPGQYRHLNKE